VELTRLAIDRRSPERAPLNAALEVLRSGGLVAYPTEHFYALACDPRNPEAVRRLFDAKGRPADKPILLAIAEREALDGWTLGVPEAAHALVAEWPEGLTLVLPARGDVPDHLHAGTGTVGVRLVRTPVAAALTRAAGGALPATSANRSGQPASGDPDRVAQQLPGLDLLLDSGVLAPGARSTLMDVTAVPWRVLRSGAVKTADLGRFGVPVEIEEQ